MRGPSVIPIDAGGGAARPDCDGHRACAIIALRVVPKRPNIAPGATLLLAFVACSDDMSTRPSDLPASVVVHNRSQYILHELRFHRSLPYLTARNVLEADLGIEGIYLFHGRGDWYVTVYREKYKDGPILAFTMAEPMRLSAGMGYRLDVFDESFRMEPDQYYWVTDVLDAGVGDSGALRQD